MSKRKTSTKRCVLRRKLGKRPADPLICIPHGIPDVTCFRVVIAKVGHGVGVNLDAPGETRVWVYHISSCEVYMIWWYDDSLHKNPVSFTAEAKSLLVEESDRRMRGFKCLLRSLLSTVPIRDILQGSNVSQRWQWRWRSIKPPIGRNVNMAKVHFWSKFGIPNFKLWVMACRSSKRGFMLNLTLKVKVNCPQKQ